MSPPTAPDISVANLRFETCPSSRYIRRFDLSYSVNGRETCVGLWRATNSVAIVLFNTTRKKLVLVKQFRPAVYAGSLPDEVVRAGCEVNVRKHPIEAGETLELCAGILDKSKTLREIAVEEVYEECGYLIKDPESLHQVTRYVGRPENVGNVHTVFYAEVTDDMKVSRGGGDDAEGEMIIVEEMSIEEAKEYIQRDDVISPPGMIYGLMWFLATKAAQWT